MSSKCFIILSKDFFIIYSKDFYSLPFLYLTSYLSALWPKLKGKFTFFLFFFLTLQYCIGFAIHQHASATGVHMFPILNPPPHTIPLGHPNAPAPSFLYPTSNLNWQFVSYMILYMFNAILPNHPPFPSLTESKRLFYTSVSLLLSLIQGCHYHLSKFHIYVLVYCIGVFLSVLYVLK